MSGIPAIPSYPLPGRGELPASAPTWTADPARAVLLIHDMQRYFLAPFAEPLHTNLTTNVAALRDDCVNRGVPIAYTAQPGGMSDDQRGLLKDVWGPGMRTAPEDREVVSRLTPAPPDWVFTKWRYSAFHHTDLLERMRAHGRDQLVVCGVYAHVGVLVTAIEAFSHDVETFFVADASADFTAAEHRMAVDYAARRCAVVTTAKELFA